MKHKKSTVMLSLILFCTIFLCSTFIINSTFALEDPSIYTQIAKVTPDYDGSVDTTFFDNVQDDGEGCGVYIILKLITDILTYGIVIAAGIGIVLFGITYITAKGSADQVAKAKRRIIEIIIGLAAYLALWSILNFLLPGGNFNPSDTCKTASSSSSTFGQKPTYTPSRRDDASGGNGKKSSSSKKTATFKDGSTAAGHRIIEKAEEVAKDFGKYHFTYYNYSKGSSKNATSNWTVAKSRRTANCNTYVSFAYQRAKVIKKNTSFYFDNGVLKGLNNEYMKTRKRLKVKQHVNKTIKSLVKSGDVVPGDAVGPSSGHHTMIYVKHKNGKYYFHSVNGPTGQKLNPGSVLNWNPGANGNYRIGAYIHVKY